MATLSWKLDEYTKAMHESILGHPLAGQSIQHIPSVHRSVFCAWFDVKLSETDPWSIDTSDIHSGGFIDSTIPLNLDLRICLAKFLSVS